MATSTLVRHFDDRPADVPKGRSRLFRYCPADMTGDVRQSLIALGSVTLFTGFRRKPQLKDIDIPGGFLALGLALIMSDHSWRLSDGDVSNARHRTSLLHWQFPTRPKDLSIMLEHFSFDNMPRPSPQTSRLDVAKAGGHQLARRFPR